MKKLVFALLGIALVVGCGKSDSNNNGGNAQTIAVTPNDCINQGLQPAYFPNNAWNPYFRTYYYYWSYGPSYGPNYANPNYAAGPFNQNNVGCVGNNVDNFQQVNWNGQPYYYVPNQICNLNSPYNTCPAGLRCQPTQSFVIYFGLGLPRQGICAL